MQSAIDNVSAFHRKMNAPISAAPTLLQGNASDAAELAEILTGMATQTMAKATDDDVLLRRCAMALEELSEWLTAHAEGNLESVADAWADRAYVLFGDAVASGLPAEQLFDEVHRSNMTKQLDSAGTGKAIKGESYEPPQLARILTEAASGS